MARARYAFYWLALTGLGLASCGGPASPERFAGETMGTTWSVQLPILPAGSGRDLEAQIQAVLARVDAQMSTYREDSDIVRFNRSDGTEWFPVAPAVAEVVDEALQISRLSGGAFDITVGPLVELWGFGARDRRVVRPNDAELQKARRHVGFDHLAARLSPPALRKAHPDLAIDLSAIAKGHAVDRLAALLERQGADDYLIELGGELRVRGRNARGTPWRIGIEWPDPALRPAGVILPLQDGAIATSGDYRNYFEQDGRRYSHAIDPRTGEPADHALASVSVLAASASRADALATALLVLGPQAGFEVARREGIAALFIVREGEAFATRRSPALQRYLDGQPD